MIKGQDAGHVSQCQSVTAQKDIKPQISGSEYQIGKSIGLDHRFGSNRKKVSVHLLWDPPINRAGGSYLISLNSENGHETFFISIMLPMAFHIDQSLRLMWQNLDIPSFS
jgi:hypothetical protein